MRGRRKKSTRLRYSGTANRKRQNPLRLSYRRFLPGSTLRPHLTLVYNNISDVSALSGLTSLSDLGLLDNNITDLGPLLDLEFLGRVSVGDNPIDCANQASTLAALEANGTIIDIRCR